MTTSQQYLAQANQTLTLMNLFWNNIQIQLPQPENSLCYGLGPASLVPLLQQVSSLACQATHEALLAANGFAAACGPSSPAWQHVDSITWATQATCAPLSPQCTFGEVQGDPYGTLYLTGNIQGYCLDNNFYVCIANQVNAAQGAVSEANAASLCKPPPPPVVPPVSRFYRTGPSINVFALRGAK